MKGSQTSPFVSPGDPPDVLGDVLRELRFESAAYRWLELGEPFRVSFDQPGLRGVHLIARGSCLLEFGDGTSTPLAACDLVVVPRGDAHWLRSPTGVAPTVSSLDLATGRVDRTRPGGSGPGADVTVVCGAFVVGEPGHPALLGLPRTILVPGRDGRPQPRVAGLVEAVQDEARDGGPGTDLVMARLSDALLVQALRHYSAATDEARQPGWLAGLGDPYVAPALAALHATVAHPWTVEALARHVGLSRAAFSARFTRCVGVPAMTYLRALRIQRSKTLLRADRSTIASVARRVGYDSEVSFTSAFTREVGMPPGRYRRGQR